jgi:RHS repeat-associated protein
LISIAPTAGTLAGFSFDAAGRHATRTGPGGVTIETYGYLGATNTVISDVSTSGSGYTLTAAVDAIGDRLASKTASGGFAWIVPDLHGNVAAQCSASGTIVDVFRYDAYGKVIGSALPAGPVPSPWRFQGRILESTSGSDTYDFGARAYVPDLGTFTSLDTVAGSAQNPLTLNRYLYANANPATLVDPDGHWARTMYDEDGRVAFAPSNTSMPVTSARGPRLSAAERGDLMVDDSTAWVHRLSTAERGDLMVDDSTAWVHRLSTAERGDQMGDNSGPWSGPVDKCANHAIWDVGCDVNDVSGFMGSGLDTLKTIARPIVNVAVVVPYAAYWTSHEVARSINKVGAKFGLPGSIVSHILAAPLVIPQVSGLGTDIAFDAYKNFVFANGEALNDEGVVGPVLPSPLRDIIPGGGPSTYLPGWRSDGGLDLEW